MKNFKRMMSLVLALIMVFALVACGAPAASGSGSAAGETTKPVQKTRISLGTAGSSGAYFVIGSALANAINDQSDIVEMTAEVTDGSAQNMTFLASGDIEFGMSSISTLYEAYTGTGKYEGKKIENIRAVGSLHPSVFQVVVLQASGIKSVADMVGKKIVVGAPASGTRLNVNSILNCCGISDSDIIPFDLSIGESVTAMQDKDIDGSFIQSALPVASLIDLANSADIDLVSFSDAEIDAILKANPLWSKTTIPGEIYGLDYDVNTVGINNVMFCSADVSDDVAYEVTKAIYENLEAIRTINAKANYMSLEDALSGIPSDLHPGAARYYEEQGLTIPDYLK